LNLRGLTDLKCIKCGNKIGLIDFEHKTTIGTICHKCFNSIIKTNNGDDIACTQCGNKIVKSEQYANVDGTSFCRKCFDNFSEYTISNDKSDTSDIDKPTYVLSTTLYIVAGIIMVIGVFVGCSNYSEYGQSNALVPIYIFGGIVSGILFIALGKIVKAAEYYLWKNKQ
jgi:hypothetical protein